jgi:hypothetical protein
MEDTNVVDVATLKDHFTEEELAQITPIIEETSSESVEDVKQETEEVQEENTEEVSQPEGETVGKLKPSVVSYDRFKEINDKNKLLAAELAVLKAQPVQQPIQQQPPAQANQQQFNMDEWIANQADMQVRQKLQIVGEIDDLMMQDPKKYHQYTKEVAKAEVRIETDFREMARVQQQNDRFLAELGAMPNANVLVTFAEQEIEELPAKQARPLIAAKDRLISKTATMEDIALLRTFTKECAEKMAKINAAPDKGAILTSPAPSPLAKTEGLPRANSLSGAKTAAMSAVQVEQLIRDGKIDQIPEDWIRRIDPRLLE